MENVIFLSIVTASISFAVTETQVLLPFREWLRVKNSLIGDLLSCGYCLGHWIALALVVIYRPRIFESWWLVDYFLTALVIAWLGAFQWILLCWLMDRVGK